MKRASAIKLILLAIVGLINAGIILQEFGFGILSLHAATTIIDKQIAASSDDAYHVAAGWPDYSHTDTVVYVGAPASSGSSVGGWRWTGLNIPAGATITSAYVDFNQVGYGFNIATTLA